MNEAVAFSSTRCVKLHVECNRLNALQARPRRSDVEGKIRFLLALIRFERRLTLFSTIFLISYFSYVSINRWYTDSLLGG